MSTLQCYSILCIAQDCSHESVMVYIFAYICIYSTRCAKQLTGCGGMIQGLICSPGRVQCSCCAVLETLPWPRMSVGRLRDTVLVRCALCVRREGVPVNMRCVR